MSHGQDAQLAVGMSSGAGHGWKQRPLGEIQGQGEKRALFPLAFPLGCAVHGTQLGF